MSAKKKQERNQETIRKLSLLNDNKECMDCVVKGTPYVIMDFGIFVCTFCSGVHRNFNFKAKGISMTNFEDKDVEFFETHGNKVAQATWRAKWDPTKVPKPKSTDEKGIKDFIEKTYVKKLWYDASGSVPTSKPSSSVEEVPVQPIENIIPNPQKVEVTRSNPVKPQQPSTDLFSFDEPKPVQPATKPTTNTNAGGLDNFFSTIPSHTSQNNTFGNDDNWGFPSNQPQTTSAQPSKPTINVDDLFAGFGNPQPPQQQWGGNQQQWGGNQQTSQQWGGNQQQWGNQPSQPSQQWGSGQQWGGQSQQWGGMSQQHQWGNQPSSMSQQPQWGSGQQQQWGNQPPQQQWGGQQTSQQWGGNQQQWGSQPSSMSQPSQWGSQSPPQWGNQPPQKRNLQDSPPPNRDPFSGLTGLGNTSTQNRPGSNPPPSNNNPFDF
ncbi:hypothetical protein C9374_003093 [Naegleria lovaniensis]|uniref:Arf-GAP domain-containing protein n=1 Tax=Naegleria lovaniensis TaxID=51637 RepID=A0AA88KLM0_NAELO|nr:uncharacterized protein C9374_003093 [Naegleria lovaniensis]KAG2385944.1 hypothetical protein C9374_003093 [Naegleria lovaniensis]